MKILIAGGAGYVGSVLTPRLIERGYNVTVVDLLWFGNNLPASANVINRDLMELVPTDVEGFDQVVFMAGLSNDPMAEYSPARNFVENGAAPAYLSFIAKQASVRRFIYAGSCSVYGYTVNQFYDETGPTTSQYPYGISKLQGESACLQLHDPTFSVICFRKGTVSGYSPRMRFDLIVNTMFKTAIQNGEIIVNNPAIWRPVLSIQDAVAAYIRAIEAPAEISGVFNIASGNYTVGEVADLVAEGMEKCLGTHIRIIIKHIKDFRNYKVKIEKAASELGFKPSHSVQDIVCELAENRDRFDGFDNDNYYNIKVFKKLQQH